MAQENPYDFILDPHQGKKKPKGPVSARKRILLMVGFLAGVVCIIIVGFVVVVRLLAPNNTDIVEAQSYQTEIARILDKAQSNIEDGNLKNRIATLDSVIASDEVRFKELIKKRKVVTTATGVTSKKNTKTDDALDAAKQEGNYDAVLQTSLEELIASYYEALETALKDASTKAETDMIKNAIANIETVLGN
jgi:hypothetical protein